MDITPKEIKTNIIKNEKFFDIVEEEMPSATSNKSWKSRKSVKSDKEQGGVLSL